MTLEQAKAIVATGTTYKEPGKTYFFLSTGEYMRYDNQKAEMDADYPKLTTDNWPISPAHAKEIIGVVEDPVNPDKTYFFLNTGEYMRYNSQDKTTEQLKSTSEYWGLSEDEAKSISGVGTDSAHPSKIYFFLNSEEYYRHHQPRL